MFLCSYYFFFSSFEFIIQFFIVSLCLVPNVYRVQRYSCYIMIFHFVLLIDCTYIKIKLSANITHNLQAASLSSNFIFSSNISTYFLCLGPFIILPTHIVGILGRISGSETRQAVMKNLHIYWTIFYACVISMLALSPSPSFPLYLSLSFIVLLIFFFFLF